MTLSPEVVTAIIGFSLAFIIKEAWDFIKKRRETESKFISGSLEKNTEAINELKVALVELKVRIDHLSEKLAPVPRLSQDINEAHVKIRALAGKLEGADSGAKS